MPLHWPRELRMSRVLNVRPYPAQQVDVLAALRAIVVARATAGGATGSAGAVLQEHLRLPDPPQVSPGTPGMRVYCGTIPYGEERRDPEMLFVTSGRDALQSDSCVLTSFVRMLCFGGKPDATHASEDPFAVASALRNAAVTVLRPVTREVHAGALIHSVMLGTEQSQLDPVSMTMFVDLELTVVSSTTKA